MVRDFGIDVVLWCRGVLAVKLLLPATFLLDGIEVVAMDGNTRSKDAVLLRTHARQ